MQCWSKCTSLFVNFWRLIDIIWVKKRRLHSFYYNQTLLWWMVVVIGEWSSPVLIKMSWFAKYYRFVIILIRYLIWFDELPWIMGFTAVMGKIRLADWICNSWNMYCWFIRLERPGEAKNALFFWWKSCISALRITYAIHRVHFFLAYTNGMSWWRTMSISVWWKKWQLKIVLIVLSPLCVAYAIHGMYFVGLYFIRT